MTDEREQAAKPKPEVPEAPPSGAGPQRVRNASRDPDAATRWPTCPECHNQVGNAQFATPETRASGTPVVHKMCECAVCGHRWELAVVAA